MGDFIGWTAEYRTKCRLPSANDGMNCWMQSQRRSASRILLVAFTLWGLAMIVPDLYRWDQPLGSFGFYANNDGVITDVQGPFPDEAASPAFAAGLRRGDRLDLTQMRCTPINTLTCASTMAATRRHAPASAIASARNWRLSRPTRNRRGKSKSSPSNVRTIGGSWQFCCSINSPRCSLF